jgi:hypothetical protein
LIHAVAGSMFERTHLPWRATLPVHRGARTASSDGTCSVRCPSLNRVRRSAQIIPTGCGRLNSSASSFAATGAPVRPGRSRRLRSRPRCTRRTAPSAPVSRAFSREPGCRLGRDIRAARGGGRVKSTLMPLLSGRMLRHGRGRHPPLPATTGHAGPILSPGPGRSRRAGLTVGSCRDRRPLFAPLGAPSWVSELAPWRFQRVARGGYSPIRCHRE